MRSRLLALLTLILLFLSVTPVAAALRNNLPTTAPRPGTDISILRPQGVNLRVTDLKIDDATGYVYASVENTGTPMTKDAKVRMYMGDSLLREFIWSKELIKRTCSKTVFESTDPAGCSRCEGRSDRNIRFQIVEGDGERHFSTTGLSKEGTLHARQDLAVEYLTVDPGGRISAFIGNRGIADSTTWRCKVYWNGILKQTSAFNGAIAAHRFVSFLLDPQPPQLRTLKIEIVPTDPLNELNAANNIQEFISPFNLVSNFDLRVMDIQLYGEVMWRWMAQYPQDCGSDNFYSLIPTIKNISNKTVPPGVIMKYETFVDGVSSGVNSIGMGLNPGESQQLGVSYGAKTILPPGTHTVKFKIDTADGFTGNSVLEKVMYRP